MAIDNNSIGSEKTFIGSGGQSGGYTLSPGDTLGQYRIIRPLGRGGMGEVYQVQHETLGARHALKTILPAYAVSADFKERFLCEARLMSRLRHPNIVHCADAGEVSGISYLVMDYVEGPAGQPMDLQQLLNDRREKGSLFDEDEAVAVGLQLCDALAYAHSYRDSEVPGGLIHRDLKPANILLDKDTNLLVTDFGLARLIGKNFERSMIELSVPGSRSVGAMRTMGQVTPTRDSDRVGTFDYMSPEQREGRDADARCDVYALGVILYELLTGRKVAGVPQRPSKARPGLSPIWDEIIYEKCLAADPDDRYASASELKAAIEEGWDEPPARPANIQHQADRAASPVLTQHEISNKKGSRVLSRRIVTWAAAAGVVLALAVGAGAWWLSTASTSSEGVHGSVRQNEGSPSPRLSEKQVIQSKLPADLRNAIGFYIGTGGRVDERRARELFEKAAKGENEHARMWLARLYHVGRCGIKKDTGKAQQLASPVIDDLNKLAAAGDPDASFLLGSAFEEGLVVQPDNSEAAKWYTYSAEAGNPLAMENLARMYSIEGSGLVKDYSKSVRFYREAAEIGSVRAMLGLGGLYLDGNGVAKDQAIAFQWYQKAADRGQSDCMYNVGLMYMEGLGIRQSDTEAAKWLSSAVQAGNTKAGSFLGQLYLEGRGVPQDHEKAFELTRAAAEAGYATEMFNLGLMYEKGQGVDWNHDEALVWLRRAAANGNNSAGGWLKVLAKEDQRIAKERPASNDPDGLYRTANSIAAQGRYGDAEPYLRKAAELGNHVAQYNLGMCYVKGWGVPGPDYNKAAQWYSKSAKQGNATAQRELGLLYLQGNGVGKSNSKATLWLRKAAAQGDNIASNHLKNL